MKFGEGIKIQILGAHGSMRFQWRCKRAAQSGQSSNTLLPSRAEREGNASFAMEGAVTVMMIFALGGAATVVMLGRTIEAAGRAQEIEEKSEIAGLAT